eukprot:g25827.t1
MPLLWPIRSGARPVRAKACVNTQQSEVFFRTPTTGTLLLGVAHEERVVRVLSNVRTEVVGASTCSSRACVWRLFIPEGACHDVFPLRAPSGLLYCLPFSCSMARTVAFSMVLFALTRRAVMGEATVRFECTGLAGCPELTALADVVLGLCLENEVVVWLATSNLCTSVARPIVNASLEPYHSPTEHL